MSDLSTDEVQELINLTPDQAKAFRKLELAVKACRKSNIYFYQVLEHLGALNGNNVRSVENEEYSTFDSGGPRDLNTELICPTVITDCGFADDTHVVILNGD